MSGDEVFALLVSCVIAGLAWGTWLRDSIAFNKLTPPGTRPARRIFAPLVCAAILISILKLWSSHDVRDSWTYMTFYLVMGAAWVGVMQRVISLGGINARDDVFERHNTAAAHAYRGALVGLTLCFAGGNIGDGPGWWVVIFSALLATATWLLLWLILDRFTGAVDTITIDRDQSSGLRAAGYFIGTGLILGRAVAGDWESAVSTVRDFGRNAWAAAALTAIAIIFEWVLKPTALQKHPLVLLRGWLPAIILTLLGALSVLLTGEWK